MSLNRDQSALQIAEDVGHAALGLLELTGTLTGTLSVAGDIVRGGLAIAGRSTERMSTSFLKKGVNVLLKKTSMDLDLSHKSVTEMFYRFFVPEDPFKAIRTQRAADDISRLTARGPLHQDPTTLTNYYLRGQMPVDAPTNFGDLANEYVRNRVQQVFHAPLQLFSRAQQAFSESINRQIYRFMREGYSYMQRVWNPRDFSMVNLSPRQLLREEETVTAVIRDPELTDYARDDYDPTRRRNDNGPQLTRLAQQNVDQRRLLYRSLAPPEEDEPLQNEPEHPH